MTLLESEKKKQLNKSNFLDKYEKVAKIRQTSNNMDDHDKEEHCKKASDTSPSTITSTILGGTIISSTNFANFDSATCLKNKEQSYIL